MTTPKHDLEHEVYLDPKDGKEHINHGMLEYSKEDLEMHNDAFHAHSEDEVNNLSLDLAKLPDRPKESLIKFNLV